MLVGWDTMTTSSYPPFDPDDTLRPGRLKIELEPSS